MNYFKCMILDHHLIDLLPDEVVPTWRNGRIGMDSISKNLDQGLVLESLLNDVGMFQTWIDLPFVSDHAPVVAQFDF